MKSFFRELAYCEKTILNEDSNGYTGKICYSYDTKCTLRELISFIESGEFINAKAGKFIASHFRMNTDELCKAWYKEFKNHKVESTIRGQVSEMSRVLYRLFGNNCCEELLTNEHRRVQLLLNSFTIGNLSFNDIFIEGLSKRIKKQRMDKNFNLSELENEIKFLSIYKSKDFLNLLNRQDQEKLAYIENILNMSLIVDYKVNAKKAVLLNELLQPDKLQIKELSNALGIRGIGDVSVPSVLIEILGENYDAEKKVEKESVSREDVMEVVATIAKHSAAMIRSDFEVLNPNAIWVVYNAILGKHGSFHKKLSTYQSILCVPEFSKETNFKAMSFIHSEEE